MVRGFEVVITTKINVILNISSFFVPPTGAAYPSPLLRDGSVGMVTTRRGRRDDHTTSVSVSLSQSHSHSKDASHSGYASHVRTGRFVAEGTGGIDLGRRRSVRTSIIEKYALCATILLTGMCVYTHYYSGGHVYQRILILLSAVTLWAFPAYYCQGLQEYLNRNESKWRWIHRFHRTMGQNSADFFGLPATDSSRAISCFNAYTFFVNFSHLVSTSFAGNERDMDVLWCVVGIQCVLWAVLVTIHKMIPKQNEVFDDLSERGLKSESAYCFILTLATIAAPSIIKLILMNADALYKRDAYMIAFCAVFAVDVVWYTLGLFLSDDTMMALTRRPGKITIEVFNSHYLILGLLSKGVYILATMSLSGHAKRTWIFVEFLLQTNACWLLTWVIKRYAPDVASRHLASCVLRGFVLMALFIALCIDNFKPS